MRNRTALKCTLGVVVAALFLAVTWSTTAARLSAWTSSSAVKPNGIAASAPKKLMALRALAQSTATVATDKSDYAPGSTVTVTGSGWAAGETVTLSFAENPYIDGPHVLTTVADDQGNINDNHFVVDLFDGGIAFTLTATGGSSGLTATTTFTDSPQCGGAGTVTVTGNGGSCVSPSPAQGGGPFNWEVVQGGSYNMTISGVTECSGSTITVFIQNTQTGNFCFNATMTAAGTYTGTFTMPNPACFTSPISYKCGADQTCDNSNTFNARGPDGACTAHLRANTFAAGCTNPVVDEDCTGGGPQGCLLTAPPGGDLGCNPSASLYACGTATGTGCVAEPVCTPGVPENTGGCSWKVVNTYTCTGADGVQCTDYQTFTFTRTTAPVFDNCTDGTTPLGCNPTLPSCDEGVTAHNECGVVSVSCEPGTVTEDGCNRSRSFVYTATACGLTSTCTKTFTWTVATAPVFDNCTTGTTPLGCNPTPPSCVAVTAHNECGAVEVSCTPGQINSDGCSRSQSFVYSATACGLTSTCTRSYTWTEDTTAPVITTPGNLMANASGACCANVIYEASARDNCGLASFGCSPPSGSCFPIGTTTVTCTAVANCGPGAESSFTVTVKGQICATKFYDADASGSKNGSEGVISGWKITLSDGQSGYTGADGKVCFDVLAGTYTVTEVLPSANWVSTTGTTCTKTISADTCTATCTFGNFCKTSCNGLTLGFWTNRNGQNILEGGSNHNIWVALLNNPCGPGTACLRNADGTIHTFSTYTDLKNWLNGATATNMAYMLSAQLAANLLDGQFNGLSGSTGMIVPGGMKTLANVCIVNTLSGTPAITCGSPALLSSTSLLATCAGCSTFDGFVTIGALRSRACCLLAAYGNTTASSTQRTYQECVKDLLDVSNNNGNPSGSSAYPCGPAAGSLTCVSPTPCSFTANY